MKLNIDGVITELSAEEEALYNPEIPTISDDSGGGVKLPSWKKIRTITIPSDDYKGQEIDGVSYGYSDENGIKSIFFKTDSDGNNLADFNITGLKLKVTPSSEININQAFASLSKYGFNVSTSACVDYITAYNNTKGTRWFEYSINPSYKSMLTNTTGQYVAGGNINYKRIEAFGWGGHEATSVLGEGTKIEVWAYGYWDE